MRRLVGSLALALACSGCFTLDQAKSPLLAPDAEAHVVVRNYGWNLFGSIPLACGNADVDSIWGSTFFIDEVTPAVVHRVLARHAAETGYDIRDFQIFHDRKALFVPLSIGYVPIPWIVQYKEVDISATLVRKGVVR